MWSNFHTHSNFCDGKGNLKDYLGAADSLFALGYSSHAPLPFNCTWSMHNDLLDTYLLEIEELKAGSRIFLYKGLEVDFIPGVISPADFSDKLDYTIGSIHFVDRLPDGRFWEIDGSHSVFVTGLDAIFGNDVRAAVTRYFELTREMILTARPSIVGHLDKIKIQNREQTFFDESERWYLDEVGRTLDLVKESGAIVEVNTRGLYQGKSVTTYPSPWILEQAYEKEIPVVISSDAHSPADLTNLFSETARLLRQIGFRQLSTLHDGRWQPVDFTENGILLEHHRI